MKKSPALTSRGLKVSETPKVSEASDKVESRYAIATLQARSARSLMKIMDAAEDILRSDGADALTIPEVSERSGVSIGGIYRRFQGKQDILRAVKGRLLSQLEENVRQSMNVGLDSLQAVVRRYVTVSIDEMSSRGGLYTLILANQGDDPIMFKLGHDLIAHNFQALRNQLVRFRKEIGHDDPELAIQMASIMILSAVTRRNVRFPAPAETMSWDVFGRELTQMITLYLYGT